MLAETKLEVPLALNRHETSGQQKQPAPMSRPPKPELPGAKSNPSRGDAMSSSGPSSAPKEQLGVWPRSFALDGHVSRRDHATDGASF
jgi:hypothetical protein